MVCSKQLGTSAQTRRHSRPCVPVCPPKAVPKHSDQGTHCRGGFALKPRVLLWSLPPCSHPFSWLGARQPGDFSTGHPQHVASPSFPLGERLWGRGRRPPCRAAPFLRGSLPRHAGLRDVMAVTSCGRDVTLPPENRCPASAASEWHPRERCPGTAFSGFCAREPTR